MGANLKTASSTGAYVARESVARTPLSSVYRNSAAVLPWMLCAMIAAGPARAGGALPSNGQYVAGQGSIASSANNVTVNQTSSHGIINWQNFSIGQGNSVLFNNGSGATLNRVTGGQLSQIDGSLKATGSVYLINPQGIVIGPSGQVITNGSFIASTRDVDNNAFMSGQAFSASGTSNGSIINQGVITSNTGDAILVGSAVTNTGSIFAPNGTVGLAAGNQITLQPAGSDSRIAISGGTGSVTNSGNLKAAQAELNAAGGNVYALVENNGGAISATGTTNVNGHVWLTAGGTGTVTIAGAINAQNANGSGGDVTVRGYNIALPGSINASATSASGQGGSVSVVATNNTTVSGTVRARGGANAQGGSIETSGHSLSFGGANIDAGKGGNWLLDPVDLTVDQSAATTIDNSLGQGTSVTLQTTATGANGPGNQNASGVGDINIDSVLSWSTSATLTLDAFHSINILAPVAVQANGQVVLTTNDGGTGGGLNFGLGATGFIGDIQFTDVVGGTTQGGLTINGASFTLVNSVSQLASAANANPAGNYALANNYNAGGDGAYTTSPVSSLTGAFEGLGNTISNLTIDSASNVEGLFANSTSSIENVGLTNISVSTGGDAGALVGTNSGKVLNSYATGAIGGGTGTGDVGGLVINNSGTIAGSFATTTVTGGVVSGGLASESSGTVSNSYATGTVSGVEDAAGGLLGFNAGGGSILDSYATGAVSSGGSAGGLVGTNSGLTISDSYATGNVSGGFLDGGLVGNNTNGTSITNSYATGAVSGSTYVGGLVGTNSGAISDSYATGDFGGGSFYNGGLVGENEGTITDSYATGSVSGTPGTAGGLVGLNNDTITDSYATGAISASSDGGGLVGYNQGTIEDAFATGVVSGRGRAGGLAGSNAGGEIENSYATGQVNSSGGYAGGLVGANFSGTISSSYATGAVSGSSYVGGLVGHSGGAISDSYATGFVSGSKAGGLVGENVGSGTINDSFWNVATSGTSSTAIFADSNNQSGNVTGLTTAAFQSGSLPGSFDPTVWGTGPGLYPYLAWQYPTVAPQAISGFASNAAPGSQVVVYTGGAPLGIGTVSTGADGYFYETVPSGTITSSTKLGETITLASASSASGYAYTDQPTLTSGNVVNFNIASGTESETTAEPTLSALYPDVAATFGTAYPAIVAGIPNPTQSIRATNASGFTVDQSLALSGLTIDATQGIAIDAPVTISGGAVVLTTNDGGTGGTLNFVLGPGGFAGNIEFIGAESPAQSLTINGAPYTLVYSMSELQNINANPGGNYALALPLDATGVSWMPLNGFSGIFEGLGNTISNLTVNNNFQTGLFGISSGIITSVGLNGGSVTGSQYVGDLVGDNTGTVDNSYATGAVNANGGYYVGGLVGLNTGSITNSYATGTVTANGATLVGGLAGSNGTFGQPGSIEASYATGNVTGGYNVGGLVGANGYFSTVPSSIDASRATGNVSGIQSVGGLAGFNMGLLTNSYALGTVSGTQYVGGLVGSAQGGYGYTSFISGSYAKGAVTGGNSVGGLIGYTQFSTIGNSYASGAVTGTSNVGGLIGDYLGGTLTNSFYDIDTTLINGAPMVTIGGIYDAQYQDWTNHNETLTIANYFGSPDASGYYSVSSLQDFQNLLGFAETSGLMFKLTQNIDLSGAPGFFVPYFAGAAFDGQGFTVSNLAINQPNSNLGLFGYVNNVTLSNLRLTNVSVSGNSDVGGLVGALPVGSIDNVVVGGGTVSGGYNVGGLAGVIGSGFLGTGSANISGAGASVAISGSHNVGGLVGQVNGGYGGDTIANSYATGAVSGGGYAYDIGGLVGTFYAPSSNAPSLATISNSFATGSVSGAGISGSSTVGGLVGYSVGTIENSYATGAVSVASGIAGGLAGGNNGVIDASYAMGAVSNGGGGSGQFSATGGLVGTNYNLGRITDSYATGDVSAPVGAEAGGVIGNNDSGTVSDSFWNTQTTGMAVGIGADNNAQSGHVTGLPTAQLQGALPGSFDNTVWGIGPGLYPYFSWQYPTTPQAISGTAYDNGGATVAVLANGANLGSASAGANGYFYLLEPAGTLSGGTTALIAYTTGTNAGARVDTLGDALNANGNVTGLDILVNTLIAPTTATAYSQASATSLQTQDASFIAQAIGANPDPAAGLSNYGYIASGNFTVDQPLTLTNGLYVKSAGNIIVGDALTLPSNNAFVLNAAGNVAFDADVTVMGGGALSFSTGAGSAYSIAPGADIDFTAPESSGASLTINGNPYKLLYSMGEVQAISNNLTRNYALATSLNTATDPTTPANWSPIGGGVGFSGTFEGLGNTISNLTINASNGTSFIGMFGQLRGTIRDVGLIDVAITGGDQDIGGLVGTIRNGALIENSFVTGSIDSIDGLGVGGLGGYNLNGGSIVNSYATVSVSGNEWVGGLVGASAGAIARSYATGSVTAFEDTAGGLVGFNQVGGTILDTYAMGSVNAGRIAGGLVGENNGGIADSYATAYVTGGEFTGGLVGGNDAQLGNSYWDTQTSGQANGVGASQFGQEGTTGLTTAQLQGALPTNFNSTDTAWGTGTGLFPYFLWQYPTTPQAISGTAFGTPGQMVAADVNGTGLVASASEANGYYYLVAPAGLLSGSNTALLVYTPGANAGAHVDTLGDVQNGAGNVAGFDILDNMLIAPTTASTYSAASATSLQVQDAALIAQAVGANADPTAALTSYGYITSGGFTIDEPLTLPNGLYVAAHGGDIVVNDDVTVTGGGVELSTSGNLTFALGANGFLGSLQFTAPEGSGQFLAVNGNAYTLVYSMGELQNMNANLNTNYALATSLDAATDPTMPAGWTPIGGTTHGGTQNAGFGFTGTFDGLGNTIANFTVSLTRGNVGLFGTATGQIYSVGLVGGSVTGGYSVGDLIGWNQGTIYNSYATGDVNGVVNGSTIGGLVGANYGVIDSSYAAGNVSVSGAYAARTGGLVGENNANFGHTAGAINNSYATGAVTGNNEVGGLVGVNGAYNNPGSINTSYATGSVSGNYAVGGLAGWNFSPITNSYATGSVTGTQNVGGLVGANFGNQGVGGGYNGSITNSHATGAVSGIAGAYSAGGPVGGLVGFNSHAPITSSYATGDITAAVNVGGLIGEYQGGTLTNAFYDVDAVSINGGHAVTIGGLYDAQYQDWIGHNETLNIANYFGSPDANGYYSISSVQDFENLLGFAGTPGLMFKLTANIDLSSVPGFSVPYFAGAAFDGQGYTISNLNINLPNNNTGLFGFVVDADLSNVTLTNVSVTSTGGNAVGGFAGTMMAGQIENVAVNGGTISGSFEVGGLVGENSANIDGSSASANVNGSYIVGGLVGENNGGYSAGVITNSHASGAVAGTYMVGGLGGYNSGMIATSYATGAVTTTGTTSFGVGAGYAGGLVGNNAGTIVNSYAMGAVSTTGGYAIGGLVGNSYGSISTSYATGAVSAPIGVNGGGVVGQNSGTIVASYWDMQTSGMAAGIGSDNNNQSGNVTGLTTAQMTNASNFAGFSFGGLGSGATWVLVDADGSINNAGSAAGGTMPMLLSEYSTTITNAHQMQLIALAPQANYTLAGDIDMAGTSGGDVWSSAGFVPVNLNGSFDGGGYTISNLTENNAANTGGYGLFRSIRVGASVDDLVIEGFDITGATNVGALAGANYGTIQNVLVEAGATPTTVTGQVNVGGLVGLNYGNIGGSGATVSDGDDLLSNFGGAAGASANVSGTYNVGGLVGWSGGSISGSASAASYATGTVTSPNQAGGFIGRNAGTITDGLVYSSTVSGGTGSGVGGFVGLNDTTGTITASAVTGSGQTITGASSVGGFAGGNFGTLTSDQASGLIVGNGSATWVGGFVGWNTNSITTSSDADQVIGTSRVGGFVGENTGMISQSSAQTTVLNSAATSVSGTSSVGGFAGRNDTGGDLTNDYATGSVGGSSEIYVGGFVGWNAAAISNAYADGTVVGQAGSTGAFVGENVAGASVTDAYFDSLFTGTLSAVGMNLGTLQIVAMGGAGQPDPTAEGTYSTFGFGTIWTIAPGELPTLLHAP